MTEDRAYPQRPICGVGVIAFRGDELVLIRRGKEPRIGEWSIPGGAVELGESLKEAALREFQEECAGDIELRGLADALDIIARDKEGRVSYHYVVVDYWADWKGGNLTPAGDVTDARWVPLKDLDSYPLPTFTRAVIEKAIKARDLE